MASGSPNLALGHTAANIVSNRSFSMLMTSVAFSLMDFCNSARRARMKRATCPWLMSSSLAISRYVIPFLRKSHALALRSVDVTRLGDEGNECCCPGGILCYHTVSSHSSLAFSYTSRLN